MDQKTKSIVIGFAGGASAILVIVLLFLSIVGLTGGKKNNNINHNNHANNNSQMIVESNGQTIILFDDSEDDDVASEVSSKEEVSSEPVKLEACFGRDDVDSVTKSADKFSELVAAVSPVSYTWDTESRKALSEVKVKLTAADGSFAVIGVPYKSEGGKLDGEASGSGEDIKSWSFYKEESAQSCTLVEVVMFSNNMKFNMPRNIVIGTAYAKVSEAYLKLDNPDKTYLLYEYTDVLKAKEKINAYKKASKTAYIGGKVYKAATFVNTFYPENNEAYPFHGKCNTVIRYGFNSICDTKSTSGQWYIEYATKDYKVVGVRFYQA